MKLTILFIMLTIAQVGAKTYAQKLTFKQDKVSINQVFAELRKQTGYSVLWKPELLNAAERIEANFNGASLDEVMKKCLSNKQLTYTIDDKTIVIRKLLKADGNITSKFSLKVTGYIIDATTKTPLPGALVKIKGMDVVAPTSSKGYFSISNVPNDAILMISYIGYKTKSIPAIDVKEGMFIELAPTEQNLNEVAVVNTGYQALRKKDMAGAQNTLTMDSLMMPAYTSLDQMLQGRVPGLIAMNTSVRPGSSPTIQIRGSSTFLGNRDPLWVVDGVIQEDPIKINSSTSMTQDLKNIIGNQISWLNPHDIESVTVLKDASATAVYGSKASNGVIVVTTKKGVANRTSISYGNNISFQDQPNYGRFNLMNSQERIQFSQEAFNAGVNYSSLPIKQFNTYEGLMLMFLDKDIDEATFVKQKAYLETLNTDWLDLLTRNAIGQNHYISLSGGTNKVTYNTSVGYMNNNGIEINNNGKNLSGRLQLNLRLDPKFKIDVSIVGTSATNQGYAPNVNPLTYATTTSRSLPAFENGNQLFYRKRASYKFNTGVKDLGYNIFNEIEQSGSSVKNDKLTANLNLDWKIMPWLSYQVVGGFTIGNIASSAHSSEETFAIARNYRGYDYNSVTPTSAEFKAAMLPFGGELFTENSRAESYNIQNKLVFSKIVAERHRFNALLGVELRSGNFKSYANSIYGYLENRGETLARPTAPGNLVPIGTSAPTGLGLLDEIYTGGWKSFSQLNNYLSAFATFAYTLSDKYVFNGSIRNDASNRFGQDVNGRFDPTYSLGVAWHMADENFMKEHVQWISDATFRGTYGVQGNVLNNISPDLILIQQGVANVYNQYTSIISKIPNPNLTWERTKNWNFGLDLRLFNKINVAVDYYDRLSNAVIEQRIAMENGRETMTLNGGMISNKGLEFTLNLTPVSTKNFAWSTSLNSSKNWNQAKSKALSIDKLNFIGGRNDRIVKEGYPVSGFWSYDFSGLNETNGFPMFNRLEATGAYTDPSQFLVYSGTSDPYFTGGLSNSVRYKSISLSADFALLLGGKKRLKNPYSSFLFSRMPDADSNFDKDLLLRWKKPGDEAFTNIPGFFTGLTDNLNLPDGAVESAYTMWANSDERVVDASFLRCRQVSFTWNAPKEMINKIKVKNLAVSATANNLFVVASKRFNGFDPELLNSVMPRMYSLGINIGF